MNKSQYAEAQLVAAMHSGLLLYNDGRLYSRAYQGRPVDPPRLVDKTITSQGYRVVRWYDAVTPKGYPVGAHRVIWIFHHGELPDEWTINHINGQKTDNHIENLTAGPHSDNIVHSIQTGLRPTELTSEDVLELRQLYATGKYTQRDLAVMFNVGKSLVGKILLKEAYGYVR